MDFFRELKGLTDALGLAGVDYALCGGVALARQSLKLAAGRPQDLVDVERLRELERG
jgi:hypothetical protein